MRRLGEFREPVHPCTGHGHGGFAGVDEPGGVSDRDALGVVPGTIQDDGYRQRSPGQALRFTGSRWLTGRRAALGVGGAVAPAADKSLRARQAANTEGPADSSRAFSVSPGNYPENSPKDN